MQEPQVLAIRRQAITTRNPTTPPAHSRIARVPKPHIQHFKSQYDTQRMPPKKPNLKPGANQGKKPPPTGPAADAAPKPEENKPLTTQELIGGRSWTGKLPQILFYEHCIKAGWQKPDYTMVPPPHPILIVTPLPTPLPTPHMYNPQAQALMKLMYIRRKEKAIKAISPPSTSAAKTPKRKN